MAALHLVLGVLLAGTGWAARTGRLPRNRIVGMRLPSTSASDAAWHASHRASAWSMVTAGALSFVAAAALLLVPEPSEDAIVLVTAAGVVALLLAGGVQAHRVAEAVQGGDSDSGSGTQAR